MGCGQQKSPTVSGLPLLQRLNPAGDTITQRQANFYLKVGQETLSFFYIASS
ncbi:hypothetical protein [Almyronema epifaneia]|uniref:Uncharacterized protein n=1 Tax=Almyronema epifaneia S1 TaxID=2991925 RepID=A0ABW6IB51_9CYAN